MKQIKLFLVFLCVLFSQDIWAQSETPVLTISGRLHDTEMKEPVSQATIQLFLTSDSSFVGGTVSNEKGAFSVEAPSAGSYRLKISSIGYQTIEREVTLRRNQNEDLGYLQMSAETVMLKETVVTARVSPVIVKKDTLVYSPEAFRTPEGSAIEELIKRIPGAEVDEDGNITINGKEVKKILVDGKEFMLGDVETALKNLPVSIIQNVKFYDQQSDQARITGIEDGEKETVLDFSVKKGMNRGYMTNLDLAGGTKHRYASRGMASHFTDVMRLVVLGNFNNKEENAGWWNRRGLNARKMLGTNLNYDDGDKLKVDFNIRWRHNDGDNQNENASENTYSDTYRTFSNSITKDFSRSNNWNMNARMEWKPDTLTNIMMRANGSVGTSDGTGTSLSATFSEDPYLYVDHPLDEILSPSDKLKNVMVNRSQSANLSYGENKNIWSMLQLYRRLNPRGRNIMVRLEGSMGSNRNRSVSDNNVYLFMVKDQWGQDSTYYTARYHTTPTDNNGYVVSTTYSEPLWKGAHLQANYELRYSMNKSDRKTYDFSREPQDIFAGISPQYREWTPWLSTVNDHLDTFLDRSLSRYSEYRNYTHNIRLTLRHKEENYDYNIGFLVQPQHSDFIQDYRGIHVDTVRNVTNLTPTLDYHYKFRVTCGFTIAEIPDSRRLPSCSISPTTPIPFISHRVTLD